jgi:predicted membrane GTPase involved in stress response
VNIVKEKKLTNMRASTPPMKPSGWCRRGLLNLEQAIEFIRDDSTGRWWK